MIAESRHNLANWIMWLILLVALPPALVRCRQQLFSNRVILEGKGAEFLDSEESRMLTVRLAGPAFSDRDVVRLRGLPVDRVMLRDSAISDQALKELAEHHEIVTLDLSGTNVTSAGIRTLATFPKLIQLRIEDCRGIAAADLEPLTRSRSLRILMLGAVNYSRDELHRLDTTFPIPVSIDPAAYLDTPAWLRPVWLQGKHAAVKLNFFGSPDRPRQTAVLAMQLAALRHPEIVEQLHVYFIGVPEPNAPSRIEGVETCFPHLKSVCISGAADAELRTLGGCRSLKELDAIEGYFTDAGILYLSQLDQLKRLTLQSPHVNGSGLKALGQLTNLEKLDVACTAAVPADLQAWNSLDKLQALSFSVRYAAGERLAPLGRMASLEVLSFGATDLSQTNLDWIGQLGKLRCDPRKVALTELSPVKLE